MKISFDKPVGVVGAGGFGTVVANILSANAQVYLYARKPQVVEQMKTSGFSHGQKLKPGVTPTGDLQMMADQCEILFPVVPSSAFRESIKKLAPFLHPYHILIHGTKGLDIKLSPGKSLDDYTQLTREQVLTMSEVIQEETDVLRVGCLAGPNLAKEIADNQPAATVVASRFEEVIQLGQKLLRNDMFQVYGNQDLIGVELCGVLKNIIAIASGALSGLGLGENARALLVSRGIVEMIHLGVALGGNTKAFLGLAGIGDLVATCSSTLSRNYTVGYRMAKGENLEDIIASMDEVAEGVKTIKITNKLVKHYKVRAPITEMSYKVLFENLSTENALQYLMKYPFNVDIDFL